MFTLLEQYGVKTFVVDTYADLESLPNCLMGSAALVLDESEVYMKNGEGSWVKL